jgi:hypothetical protein
MDLYHLRQGLHVIAYSWDCHGGAGSRVSVRGNSVRFISIIIISTILFPLVPIIATLGTLVKVCIISMEQYTIVLACMDFFQPLFPKDKLSLSPHR